jgi:hypothetical protein
VRVLTTAALSAPLLSSLSTIVNGSPDNVSATSNPDGVKRTIRGRLDLFVPWLRSFSVDFITDNAGS